MGVTTLEELFLVELKDCYDTEHRLADALATMSEATTQDDLSSALNDHRGETEQHVERLESVFDALGVEPEREECEGIEGIVEEAEEFIQDMGPSEAVLNRFAMAAAQKAERYEITAYENLLQWAEAANMDESIRDALRQNLEDEEAALEELQSMAEGFDHKAILA